MIIDKSKEMITIKVDKHFKQKIIDEAILNDKTISEYIRDAINNELTNDDISKNQSYILKVLDSIIQNIFDEKTKSINNILEAIYLKQELIIYLLKTLDDEHFEKEINDFTTTYLGDNLRTIS